MPPMRGRGLVGKPVRDIVDTRSIGSDDGMMLFGAGIGTTLRLTGSHRGVKTGERPVYLSFKSCIVKAAKRFGYRLTQPSDQGRARQTAKPRG